jgi:hypothetical protein
MGQTAAMVAVGALGVAQYQQQGALGKYNQAVQNRNAQVAEQEAQLIQQQAEFDVASFDKKFRQFEGETKVSLAKSGVVQGSGSAYRIEEANSIEAQLQRNVIKYNANVNSSRRMEEANFARIQGQVARQQARLAQIGTLTQTGTSLLTMGKFGLVLDTLSNQRYCWTIRRLENIMPKIPTFTSEARITEQAASVKSNLQIPLSQTIGTALSPLTDFVVKQAVQANDTQNRTEALTLENDFIRDMQTVNEKIANDSVLGVNKETANAYYKEQSNALINKYKNKASNNASQTLFQNNALGEVQKGIFRIEKQIDKNVFTQLNNQVDQKENYLLSQAILGDNNEFDYGVLQTDLIKLYTDAFTGKVPAPELNKIINNIPSLIQGFQANKDIGDNPRLAYLELNKGTNSELYPDLNLEQRQKLINQSKRILTEELRTQWNNVLAGSAVGKKVEFDMPLAKQVLPQIEVNRMLQAQEIITTTADNKKIIFTSNNKDISTLVEQYSEQAVLLAGEAKGQIIAQEYQKATETRVKAIQDDSAAYVYSHYPELIELNEEFNNETNNELKTQLKRQITTKMLEIQTELGVPTTQQRVMTKTEAENFVANYQKTAQGNATQSQILLQSITTNFGNNDSKALQELQAAGLPITASLAMTVFSPLEAQKAFGIDSIEEQKALKSWGESNDMSLKNVAKEIAANSDFLELETIIRRNNNIESSVASSTSRRNKKCFSLLCY